MSQIISFRNKNGVILASDSRAISFGPTGQVIELNVNRLFQLSPYTGILTGGAAEGENICRDLKGFIEAEKLNYVEEVYNAALPFLASGYERFMRKACGLLPLDPIHHLYFIIAGYAGKDRPEQYRMYLIWTKKKLPQLDGDEIKSAFSVPRIMRLEYKLNRLNQENTPLDQVLPEIRTALADQAEVQADIAPPFAYALITPEGFRKAE